MVGWSCWSREVSLLIISQYIFGIEISSFAHLYTYIYIYLNSLEDRMITHCYLDFRYIGELLIANHHLSWNQRQLKGYVYSAKNWNWNVNRNKLFPQCMLKLVSLMQYVEAIDHAGASTEWKSKKLNHVFWRHRITKRITLLSGTCFGWVVATTFGFFHGNRSASRGNGIGTRLKSCSPNFAKFVSHISID